MLNEVQPSQLSRRRLLQVTGVATFSTLLAACSTDGAGALGGGKAASSAGKVTELIVATNTSPWLSAYQAVAALYEKNTGVKVTFRTFPYDGLLTQQVNAVQQGSHAFDVFQLDEPWTSQFYDSGWAQPLTDVDAAFKLDPAINTFSSLPFWDRKTHISDSSATPYGVPVCGNLSILVYRKDIYESLGLKVPKTWEESIANGNAIRKAGAARLSRVSWNLRWRSPA